jgi:hypothetical protein|nr:MAG TPA: tail assembly chaperone [Caudoviricetes sp.]
MAKMKLTLAPLPDFKLPVSFVMPNGDEGQITFTVRHLKAKEVQELYESENIVTDSDFIMKLATGWNLEEEFNEENAKILVELYPGAALALTGAYLSALAGQRVKN